MVGCWPSLAVTVVVSPDRLEIQTLIEPASTLMSGKLPKNHSTNNHNLKQAKCGSAADLRHVLLCPQSFASAGDYHSPAFAYVWPWPYCSDWRGSNFKGLQRERPWPCLLLVHFAHLLWVLSAFTLSDPAELSALKVPGWRTRNGSGKRWSLRALSRRHLGGALLAAFHNKSTFILAGLVSRVSRAELRPSLPPSG